MSGHINGRGAASSACAQDGCACTTFSAQLFRPANCMTCFHTINLHIDEWEQQDAGTSRVWYKNTRTGQTLYSRPQSEHPALR